MCPECFLCTLGHSAGNHTDKNLGPLRRVISAGPSQLAAVLSPRDTCQCLEAFVEPQWEGEGTLLASSGSRPGLLLN